MKKNFKIVFMGTPEFAVPALRMLLDRRYDVAAVFTQPDRKAGRGHKIVQPPVKQIAEKAHVPVYQFEKVSKPEGVAALRALAPDLLVTAAYGHILTQEILDIPPLGCINVHASLLPRLRGAAPIQWAIINGEKETGVTTMYTVLTLDAGDILEQESVPIPSDMTAGELYEKLSVLGADVLEKTLKKLADGTLMRTPQDEAEATYYPMFKKGFGQIDFNLPSRRVVDFVRGTNPAPGAYVWYRGEKIKIYQATAMDHEGNEQAGTILFANDRQGMAVRTADGMVLVEQIKRQGSRCMPAKDSLRGKPIEAGYVFSNDGE